REEALDDQIVELLFRLGQVPRRLQRRDDGEVIGDLLVVEDALVRPDPALLEDARRVRGVAERLLRGEDVERLLHRADVGLGQCARIGARIRQRLVLFVQRLRERQRSPRREAEAAVGVALQARQVVERRGKLGRRFRFLGRDAGLAEALRADRFGARPIPEAFGSGLAVVFRLLEVFVEPPAGVVSGGGGKGRVDLPIVARLEGAYAFLAVDEDRERRR